MLLLNQGKDYDLLENSTLKKKKRKKIAPYNCSQPF